MKKKLLFIMGAVAFSAIGIFFQNCGKSGLDGSSLSTMDPTLQQYSEAPFAFTTKVDHISYMSCHSDQFNTHPAFYSFRLGGYYTGGIKIRDEFIKYAKSKLKPVYPNTEIKSFQVEEILAKSSNNRAAIPQAAIRSRFNFQVALGTQGATVGTDIIQTLGDLSTPVYAETLLSDSFFQAKGASIPQYLRYFPLVDSQVPGQKSFEAVLKYAPSGSGSGIGESTASIIRTSLGATANIDRAGFLSMTYAPDLGDPAGARAPANAPAKVAYGSGFSIGFSKPFISGFQTYKYSPVNVISNIVEFNLERPDSVDASSWDCSRKYLIVRRDDVIAAPGTCPAIAVSDLNAALRLELEIAHNTFPAEYWEVNPVQRCAYPKDLGVSCYDEKTIPNGSGGQKYPGVAYNISTPCFRQFDDSGTVPMNYGADPIPTPWCAEFASICVRQ